MSRSIFVPFLAAAFLVAPAALPSAFVPSTTLNLSGSAEARAVTVKSAKSNSSERTKTKRSVTGYHKKAKTKQSGKIGRSEDGTMTSYRLAPERPTKREPARRVISKNK
jgi:hypothetical protein